MAKLSKFPGLHIGNPTLLDAIERAAEHAEQVSLRQREHAQDRSFGDLLSSALASVNAMMAAASTTCQLAAPPATVDQVTDPNGNVILRCRHNPVHKWNLGGSQIP
jgi:hypothetical protein